MRPSKYQLRLAEIIALCFLTLACNPGNEEVINSQYIEEQIPYPSYKFSRNGASSVDQLEATELIDIYQSMYRILSASNFDAPGRQQDFRKLYEHGTGITRTIPKTTIASSRTEEVRNSVYDDLEALIQEAEKIVRSRSASQEVGSGYIGRHRSDGNTLFVNSQGLVVSSIFEQYTLGASMLDLILGIHLKPELYTSPELRRAHEELQFISGSNYTALEHHWDLAYGYYQAWRPWAESQGIPALKDIARRLSYAFAKGRLDLTELRYSMALEQLASIRNDLMHVVAIRAIHLLAGRLTLLNLKDNNLYALRFISEGIGMLYALQFAQASPNSPKLSPQDIKAIIKQLTDETGLWDKERLLDANRATGSLRSVAQHIAKLYGLDINSILD